MPAASLALSTTLLPAHSASRALRRYETMCGVPRSLPALAWYHLAFRLEVASRIVAPALSQKYEDRMCDCLQRYASAMLHPSRRSAPAMAVAVRQGGAAYAVLGPRASTLHRGIATKQIAADVAKRIGLGHAVLEVAS